MKTQLDCIPCFIKQSLESVRQISDDDTVIQNTLRRVLREASNFDLNLSPPEMGQIIHGIVKDETGNPDPYSKIKKRSNESALTISREVEQKISRSDDPFKSAVRFSIAGNIMDYALLSVWDFKKIEDSFNKAAVHPVDETMIEQLKKDLATAKTVLVLGDNVGETVFDKLLIKNFPGSAEVYFAAKHSPIINDATVDDALAVGLDEVCTVISNGSGAPGTVLSQCSDEFKKIYDTADVIISKGQANFETLNTQHRQIYFLTQIKCSVIGERYEYSVGDWIVTTTDKLKQIDKY